MTPWSTLLYIIFACHRKAVAWCSPVAWYSRDILYILFVCLFVVCLIVYFTIYIYTRKHCWTSVNVIVLVPVFLRRRSKANTSNYSIRSALLSRGGTLQYGTPLWLQHSFASVTDITLFGRACGSRYPTRIQTHQCPMLLMEEMKLCCLIVFISVILLTASCLLLCHRSASCGSLAWSKHAAADCALIRIPRVRSLQWYINVDCSCIHEISVVCCLSLCNVRSNFVTRYPASYCARVHCLEHTSTTFCSARPGSNSVDELCPSVLFAAPPSRFAAVV